MDTTTTTEPKIQKARSRLQRSQAVTQQPNTVSKPRHAAHRVSTSQKTQLSTYKYFRYSPLLLISLIHIFVLYRVLTTIDPASWKNVVIPSTYLPMLLLIVSTTFFTTSYIFLNTSRGIRFSLFVGTLFFLKFQHVVLSIPVLTALISVYSVVELISVLLSRKGDSKNKA
ncbi:MAG: hypothetical protein GW762_04590 [Candidatus Pacebacteria bacterium]|nr:hypothetical protein [Candidatus Paceibacterota bacterium]PIR63189.1 MAG: hypothetical protein COU64_05735 [Candidatus Pacebacteria bacterium CG10_big_fil_rev_8_21_14_0_10_40_26]PIZ78219.1 MAG: hypothetical protein COY01_05555 [Candidatus Pacebacteria bacterium CG_4_10_14_0_2_um_filter_40_20]PJA68736.1 MAG: hypothetical protein CO156_04490 [Candidatus Pacebacteria bacterium CG_4_9_14_3_um_filter_40_12]PJC41676.1 MAG: hypothetical protein CO041_03080 [Candidatus Pacebacteria bacterium CG_4_9_